MGGLAAEVPSGLLILAPLVGLPSLRTLTFPTCGPWTESVGEAVSDPLERAAGYVVHCHKLFYASSLGQLALR